MSYVVALRLNFHDSSENSNDDATNLPATERHIQYTWKNVAGISDRGWVFETLVNLGYHFNASVSINGGWQEARRYLSVKHSPYIHNEWNHYFDVSANRGNPFHSHSTIRDCQHYRSGKNNKLAKIFDKGGTCVNIADNMYRYPDLGYFHDLGLGYLSPSQDVLTVAKNLTTNLMKDSDSKYHYGFLHIRRCDRMATNDHCTDPHRILTALQNIPEVKKWVIFYYAEKGYKEKLSKELQSFSDHTFKFEDDLDFTTVDDSDARDDYFKAMVMQQISAKASARVETHVCHGLWPQVSLRKNLEAPKEAVSFQRTFDPAKLFEHETIQIGSFENEMALNLLDLYSLEANCR